MVARPFAANTSDSHRPGPNVASLVAGGVPVALCVAPLEWYANRLSGGLMPMSLVLSSGIVYVAIGVLLALGAGLVGFVPWLRAACGEPRYVLAATILAYNALGSLSLDQPLRVALFAIGVPIYFVVVCSLPLLNSSESRGLVVAQQVLVAIASIIFGTLALRLALDSSLIQRSLLLVSMFVLPFLMVFIHELCLESLRERTMKHGLVVSFAVTLVQCGLLVTPSVAFSRAVSYQPVTAPRKMATSTADMPNIVVISLDTTRADHLSMLGYDRETTPQISRFSNDCLVFTDCISTSTWTLPSHASLFTGLYPRSHGAHLAGSQLKIDGHTVPQGGHKSQAYPLGESHETLAELLATRGYSTAAIVANHAYLYRYFGLAQGFQYYDDAPGLLLRRKPNAIRLSRLLTRSSFRRTFRSAKDISSAAIRWIGRDGAQPFFLFVNYMEPHYPLIVPRADRLYSKALRRVLWKPWQLEKGPSYTSDTVAWTSEERGAYTAMYDDAIRYMDAEVGRLIASLRENGRYDESMIVVLGDHGELLGEHGFVGHIGRPPYEGLVRVPLLIKYPRGTPSGRWQQRVQTVDVFPTILRAAGIKSGKVLQGELLPSVSHSVVVEQFVNARMAEQDSERFGWEMRALYRGKYKLVARSGYRYELYDLEEDPSEDVDLGRVRPLVLGELCDALEDWELRTPMLDAAGDEETPEHVRELLKTLGYVH